MKHLIFLQILYFVRNKILKHLSFILATWLLDLFYDITKGFFRLRIFLLYVLFGQFTYGF